MQPSDADFIAAIADDLKALGRRACDLGMIREWEGPSLTFAPNREDPWCVSLVEMPRVNVISAVGATPGEAIKAFAAILDARSPAAGWATLGVEV